MSASAGGGRLEDYEVDLVLQLLERSPNSLSEGFLKRLRAPSEWPCTGYEHYWDDTADADGDTCNCGAWYRFASKIVRTPHDE